MNAPPLPSPPPTSLVDSSTPPQEAPIASVMVELTFEDYAEAVAAIQQHAGQRMKKSGAARVWTMGIGVFTGLITLALLTWGGDLDPTPDLRPAGYPLVGIYVPVTLLILLTSGFQAYQAWRAGVSKSWGARLWAVIRFLLLLGVCLGIPVLFHVLASAARQYTIPPGGPPSPAVDWYGTLFPHVFWVVVAVQTAVIMVANTALQVRRMWELQPALRRPTRVDIGQDGIVFDNGISRRSYAWAGFVRLHETRSALLLCPSELMFEWLPKRAFASTEQLEGVRRFLHANIQPPEALPGAFPVLRTPPPLPPERGQA